MICKDRNPAEHQESDSFGQAGAKAEETMAFYLRREFGQSQDVWVFNDLRFEADDGDAAQIDHLVLHRSGFILIESKSVTSKVRILDNGEWERIWNNHWQGMPSPIKQAERQAKFLRQALRVDEENLLGKMMFGKIQMRFASCPMDVFVAISDRGSIERKGEVPEVSKADLIPDRIQEIVKRHKKARAFFGLSTSINSKDGLYNFSDQEIQAISNWLLTHHCPRLLPSSAVSAPVATVVREAPAVYETVPPPLPSPVVAAPPTVQEAPAPAVKAIDGDGVGRCEKCGAQGEILWGKYGYYWKCPQCSTNMPIKEYCPSCRQKMKLRKDKTRFYKYCEPCSTGETLYYDGK